MRPETNIVCLITATKILHMLQDGPVIISADIIKNIVRCFSAYFVVWLLFVHFSPVLFFCFLFCFIVLKKKDRRMKGWNKGSQLCSDQTLPTASFNSQVAVMSHEFCWLLDVFADETTHCDETVKKSVVYQFQTFWNILIPAQIPALFT